MQLPADTVVGVNAWVLHNNKAIFGEDVDVFRPERWIDSGVEQLREMRKYLFTVSFSLLCVVPEEVPVRGGAEVESHRES